MIWLWFALYWLVGIGVGLHSFWRYRTHTLMRGGGLPAVVVLVAGIWPLWLVGRGWDRIVRWLER